MKQALESEPTETVTAGSAQIVWAVIRAAHEFEDRLEVALGAHELSVAKFGVLSTLAAAGEPITLTDLATRLSCVRSNVTQMVDRLEAEMLVQRVDDANDRRSVRAALTPKGADRAREGAETVARVQNEIASGLSESDRATFTRLLSGLT